MIETWQKLKETPFKAGFRKLLKKTFQLPDNRIVDFDIKHEGPAVCILAFTPDEQVILMKQFRPGPEKVLLEMPGGGVEDGEEPEQAAKRELLEETGFCGEMQYVGASFDCAYSSMVRFNFVAKNCKKIQEQQLDQNEFGDVVCVSLGDFRKHLRTGNLTDVESGYLCLDYLGML